MKAFTGKPEVVNIDIKNLLGITGFSSVANYPKLNLLKVLPDGNNLGFDALISYSGEVIVHSSKNLRIKDFSESGYALYEEHVMNTNQYGIIDSKGNRKILYGSLPKEIDSGLKFISNKSLGVLFNETFRFYDIEHFLKTGKLETQSIVNMKDFIPLNERKYSYIDSLGVTTENGCEGDGTFYVRVDKSMNDKDPTNDEFRRSDIFEISLDNGVPTVKKLLDNVYYKNGSISPFTVNNGILAYLKEPHKKATYKYYYDVNSSKTIGYIDIKNEPGNWKDGLLLIANSHLNMGYVINKDFEVVFACNNSQQVIEEYFPVLKGTEFGKVSSDFTESIQIEGGKIYQFKKNYINIFSSNGKCYGQIPYALKFGGNGYPDLPDIRESNGLLHMMGPGMKQINSYMLNEQSILGEESNLKLGLNSSKLTIKPLPQLFNRPLNEHHYIVNESGITLQLNGSDCTIGMMDANKNILDLNEIGKSNIFSVGDDKRIGKISQENMKYPIFENIIKNLKKVSSETEDSLVIEGKKFKKKFLIR